MIACFSTCFWDFPTKNHCFSHDIYPSLSCFIGVIAEFNVFSLFSFFNCVTVWKLFSTSEFIGRHIFSNTIVEQQRKNGLRMVNFLRIGNQCFLDGFSIENNIPLPSRKSLPSLSTDSEPALTDCNTEAHVFYHSITRSRGSR